MEFATPHQQVYKDNIKCSQAHEIFWTTARLIPSRCSEILPPRQLIEDLAPITILATRPWEIFKRLLLPSLGGTLQTAFPSPSEPTLCAFDLFTDECTNIYGHI